MLRENLQDAGQILETVLTQPLSIKGLPEGTSLLSAAQEYTSEQGEHSALSKVLRSLLENPQPTQVLVRELEIIYDDVTV